MFPPTATTEPGIRNDVSFVRAKQRSPMRSSFDDSANEFNEKAGKIRPNDSTYLNNKKYYM